MTSEQGITITWLGHAATRIQMPDGKIILLDPWLTTNPVVPESEKHQDRVDLMLISHAHFDHMADAIPVAHQTHPDVTVIIELAEYLKSKGVDKTNGVNKGGTTEWNGVEITMVDAIHSSGFMENNHPVQIGTAAGYVLRFPDGFTVYFSGDTDLFEGFSLIGRFYKPDVAILPIGDHFTMGPRQATEAIRMLNVKRVIPIHYGTFPQLTGTPEALQSETHDVQGLKIFALKPGDSLRQADLA